jgi:hypothetical protein
MPSKISAISSGSSARGGTRGTVILSDLGTEVVVVVLPGTGGGSTWRRRGKVRSSWGYGPGSAGRGLLIRLLGPCCWNREKVVSGKSESARRCAPEPEGVHGEVSDTSWLSSRAYHNTSSSLVRSPSPFRSASVNPSAVAKLAEVADHERVNSICTALRAGAGGKAEVEAWPFVVVGCEWRREEVIAGAGRHAGARESGRMYVDAGPGLWSLITQAGRMAWHRHGVVERRCVVDGRGWAADVDAVVVGAQAHYLVFLLGGRGTGHVERCGAQEARVECEVVSAVATAASGR